MKKFIFSLAVIGLTVIFWGCSGNYTANPSSNLNNSTNPLNTKTTFGWSGTAPMSAYINGVYWVADSSSVSYSFSGGYNIFSGSMKGKQKMSFWMLNTWVGNTYLMGKTNGSQYIMYQDSSTVATKYQYWTLNALLNTGGVYITRNDTTAPWLFQGLFYYTGIDSIGRSIIVTDGYFSVHKY